MTAANPVFVILGADWEYNDEYNYKTDGTHITGDVFYTNRAKADAECSRLNQVWYDGHDPEAYNNEACEEGCTWEDLKAAGFTDPYKVEELQPR